MGKRKTTEEFVKEMESVNHKIEIIGNYVNNKVHISCKCKIDGCVWGAKPNNLLNGSGCPKCGKKYRRNHEEFVQEMKVMNSNIEVIGNYTDLRTKIEFKCKIDNHVWIASPNNLLQGSGCPKCSGLMLKTTERFNDEVYLKVNNEYKVLGEYINSSTKILLQHNHKKCKNYKFKMTPSDFLNGVRCPRCSGRYKTHEEFLLQIYELVGSEYSVLEEYEKAETKILMRHNICGHEWKVSIGNFLQGSRCPNCNKSKGEKTIEEYLKNNAINYIPQKEFDGLIGQNNGNLSYDFYLPNYNLLIEYQGEQHERPVDFYGEGMGKAEKRFKKQQEHDKRKRKFAKENNIELLEIWYYDLKNINSTLEVQLNN